MEGAPVHRGSLIEQVDAFLASRHYVHAATRLSDTLRQLRRYSKVGALVEFRAQLEER
jgi:hypothetical protein